MLIIAMTNLKGEIGKTTLVIYLKTTLARRGLSVMVWNIGRQESVREYEQADNNGKSLKFEVEIAISRQLIKMSQSLSSEEFVLIDTTLGNIEASDSSILCC